MACFDRDCHDSFRPNTRGDYNYRENYQGSYFGRDGGRHNSPSEWQAHNCFRSRFHSPVSRFKPNPQTLGRNQQGNYQILETPHMRSQLIKCQWEIYGCAYKGANRIKVIEHESFDCSSAPKNHDSINVIAWRALYSHNQNIFRRVGPKMAKNSIGVTEISGLKSEEIFSKEFTPPTVPCLVNIPGIWKGGYPNVEAMRTALTIPVIYRLGVKKGNSMFKLLNPNSSHQSRDAIQISDIAAVYEFLADYYPISGLPPWIKTDGSRNPEIWTIQTSRCFSDLSVNRAQASLYWLNGAKKIILMWPPSTVEHYLAVWAHHQTSLRTGRRPSNMLDNFLNILGGDGVAPHIALLEPTWLTKKQALFIPQGWLRTEWVLDGGYTGHISWVPDMGVDLVTKTLQVTCQNLTKNKKKLVDVPEDVKCELECMIGGAFETLTRLANSENKTVKDIAFGCYERLHKVLDQYKLKEVWQSLKKQDSVERKRI